jgi:hypothetical protein
MGLRDLFIAKAKVKPRQEVIVTEADIPGVRPEATGGGGQGDSASSGTPVFLTPQSLVTFPGASLAVLILWKTMSLMIPAWSGWNVVPIILSILVGALIYYMSLTDEMTRKDRVLGGFLAFLNACYVALFVIGVPLTFQTTQSPASPPPAANTSK